MTDWTVPWAMFVWAAFIAAMLAFELYTVLIYNPRHKGKRANLTAYVSAFFQTGHRRLKYHASAWILVLTFLYFTGHFMGWWR